jgi:hypothetical protein
VFLVSSGDWNEEQILTSETVNQLEDVLLEGWYEIPPETVQNLYESISRRIAAVMDAEAGQHLINKEMCTAPVSHPCIYFHFSVSPRLSILRHPLY